VDEGSKEKDRIKTAVEAAEHRTVVPWLQVDRDNLTAKVVALPGREDVDQTIQEQLIVEFYSR
jgi:small subunit ribosomal protein S4